MTEANFKGMWTSFLYTTLEKKIGHDEIKPKTREFFSRVVLYNVTHKYLTMVATSVPSEPLFSKTAIRLNQQRNRLRVRVKPSLN